MGPRVLERNGQTSRAGLSAVLLHCGLKNVGEIELTKPTRHGSHHAPLFRISQPRFASFALLASEAASAKSSRPLKASAPARAISVLMAAQFDVVGLRTLAELD